MNKAVLLDRDGIVNVDGGYIYRPEQFHFMPGILAFCRAARAKGYLLIIVTNQSGIAQGYYTEEDFIRFNEWMCAKFEENAIPIERVYYCPYHPEKGIGKYKVDSSDRKPNPGMILKAQKDFDIDLQNSLMLGDKDDDMEAGRRAGVNRLLLLPGKYRVSASAGVTTVCSLREAEGFL